jgi:DNA-binding transcriptional regulator PaaX
MKVIMKTSTLTKALLLTAAAGCIVVAPGAAIALGAVVKLFVDAQNKPRAEIMPDESDPEKVRRSIYRLAQNKYVKIKRITNQKYKLELTKKGKKLLGKYSFFGFKIHRKHAWDGNWRMFVFDVPEKKRAVRDILREKLKNLGFFQFQKSVWIYPHECDEEMRYICEFLGTQPYALIFTGKIHDDQLLRKYFFREGVLRKADLKRV